MDGSGSYVEGKKGQLFGVKHYLMEQVHRREGGDGAKTDLE
jgi:hypothetical protein